MKICLELTEKLAKNMRPWLITFNVTLGIGVLPGDMVQWMCERIILWSAGHPHVAGRTVLMSLAAVPRLPHGCPVPGLNQVRAATHIHMDCEQMVVTVHLKKQTRSYVSCRWKLVMHSTEFNLV